MCRMPGMSVSGRRSGGRMNVRKLSKEEHGITRKLWEEIFVEDDKGFLDYYYHVKTSKNSIYVIENEEKVPVSMLQLNPYTICFGGKEETLHYIVAVATKKEYRGRGFMTRLLKISADDMYRAGEPFTFLMPAAEGIYYPHGFRFVYRQIRLEGTINELNLPYDAELKVRFAVEEDCPALSALAEQMLKAFPMVRAVRTEEYYRTLLREQKSEGGEILLVEREEGICGFVLYNLENGQAQLREPLIKREEDWDQIVRFLVKNSSPHLQIAGVLPGGISCLVKRMKDIEKKEVPIIMVRIIHLKNFLEGIQAKKDFSVRICVKDEMIPENTGCWEISGIKGEKLNVRKEEEKEGEEISVGELVSTLFGYCTGLLKEKKDALSELSEGTELIPPVFLNEIV